MKQAPLAHLLLCLSLFSISIRIFKTSVNYHRMASGARITLTSPDPTSNNAPEHTEHEHMIFSESDSDTVTFNAHKHNEMASHDAPPSSIPLKSLDIDESTTSSVRSHPQKVKITIDSVAPYESDSNIENNNNNDDDVEEKIQSSNRVDNIEESEMNMNEINREKYTKNDEL